MKPTSRKKAKPSPKESGKPVKLNRPIAGLSEEQMKGEREVVMKKGGKRKVGRSTYSTGGM